jgi:hypothetical protein
MKVGFRLESLTKWLQIANPNGGKTGMCVLSASRSGYVTGMLLILVIAVPVGMALAVAVELATGRGERIDTWIGDSHPLFARPEPDTPHMTTETPRNLQHRPTRPPPVRAARIGNARIGVAAQPQRRRALRFH